MNLDGFTFHPLLNDMYGNERWYIPMLACIHYNNAHMTKYRGRKYGKGFVVFTRPTQESVKEMVEDGTLKKDWYTPLSN